MQNLNWIKGFYRWRGGNRFFTLGHICNFVQRGRYVEGAPDGALKVLKLDNFDWLCLTMSNVWIEANESSSMAPSSTYLKLFPSEKLKIVTKCKLPPSFPQQRTSSSPNSYWKKMSKSKVLITDNLSCILHALSRQFNVKTISLFIRGKVGIICMAFKFTCM